MIKADTKKVIILGAGITGLVTAWELAKAGITVVIIEKEDIPGGLAKTVKKDGGLYDQGAHNFFTHDPAILKYYQKHLDGIFLNRKRNFRLFIFGKLVAFPFLGGELFKLMSTEQLLRVGVSYLCARFKVNFKKESQTPYLDEWIVDRYGKGLYEVYFKPYLSKVQKCDPHMLSSAMGKKKIPVLSVRKILKETYKKNFHKIPVQQQGGKSYYCKGGYGEIPNFFYRKLLAMPNVKYHGGEAVKSLIVNDNRVEKITTDTTEYDCIGADVISTLPLEQLCNFDNLQLQPIADMAKRLEYVEMRFFVMKVKRPDVTGSWFVNFNDPRIPFYRVGEEVHNEFDMVQEGYSNLIFEIPVNKGDELYKMPDEELFRLILNRFNIVFELKEQDVEKVFSLYASHANPRLIVDYQNIVSSIFDFIFSLENLFSFGRNGLFTYANLDHCTRMAIDFTEKYLAGEGREGNKLLLRKYFLSGF
jgi:protoporphyrinogen oxidase